MVKINGAEIALNNTADNNEARALLIKAIENDRDVKAWLLKALADGRLLLNVADKGRPNNWDGNAAIFARTAVLEEMKLEAFIAEMEARFNIKRTKAKDYWREAKIELDSDCN